MKKILIIEDEAYISEMYKLKFELSGYEAVVAGDGAEGIELAISEKPDLILLDLILPSMGGLEVLKKLRSDEATKNIKVYIISNLNQDREIDNSFTDGADGYFVKSSLTPAQLVENVAKIFGGEKVGVRAAMSVSESEKETENGAVKTKIATVLLFEDSEVLREMYSLGLRKAGFAVESVVNGAWGLKLAKENKFDVILLDMVMPAMDGYQVIRELKNNGMTKDVPIIILSNSAQDQEIEKAKELGVTDFLLKSQITPVRLAQEIKKVLESASKHPVF